MISIKRLGIAVISLLLLTSCIANPTLLDNSALLPVGVEQQVAAGSTSNADELRPGECILSNVGMVTGKASFQDKSIDGTFANFIYDGGAMQVIQIRNGEFSAPLIARRCDGAFDPVGFQLTIGEWREYIKLTGTDLELVIQLPSEPVVVSDIPEQEVLFGTISGMIRRRGQPVPDDTEVQIYIGGGLQQTVSTRAGHYMATTLGSLSGGTVSYLPTSIKVGTEEVRIVASMNNAVQDINLP